MEERQEDIRPMEHIGAILRRNTEGQDHYQTIILTPPICDYEQPLTLAQRINVSDLGHTFASFTPVPGVAACVKALAELAEGISPVPFVVCFGGAGNGKTHLLEALVIRLNERGLWCRYNTWAGLIGLLKRHLAKDSIPTYDATLTEICRAPRFVIDDVGMGATDTAWEMSQLETIIDYRYRYKLLTALTTNLDAKQLPPRVLSRLMDESVCMMCLNKGTDYRRLKKRGSL